MNEDSIFKGINLSINSEESPSSNRRKFLPSVGTSKAVAKPLSSHYLNTLYESTTNRRYVVLSKEGFHYFGKCFVTYIRFLSIYNPEVNCVISTTWSQLLSST